MNREQVLATLEENRARTAQIFSIVSDDDYFARPIDLRNPIVFYEGHIPAFSVNTLVKRTHALDGIDSELETLFARGIDPDAPPESAGSWPAREEVRRYVARADALVADALRSRDLIRHGDAHLHNGEAVRVILEHEQMHQETLLYMFHRIDPARKHGLEQAAARQRVSFDSPRVRIDAGVATLGATRDQFGWDNEYDAHVAAVDAFELDRYPVTNGEFLEFLADRGYERKELWNARAWETKERHAATHPLFWERDGAAWLWRGMFERTALPLDWPAYVTLDEAEAFARWRGGRVMSEAEFHRAAYTTPDGGERLQPWGSEPADESRGNFGFRRYDPEPVGASPAGASAWGVHDLVGNGWEWTSSEFAQFAGFRPMNTYPEYSADFFDGKHFVMKGASPVTHPDLIRRSFRNWFRPDYPYVYAKFRVAYGG